MSGFSSVAIAAALAMTQASDKPANTPADKEAATDTQSADPAKATADEAPSAETPPAPDDLNEPATTPFGEEEAPKEASAEAKEAQEMIDAALKKVDPEIERNGNAWRVEIGESFAMVLTDPIAERMRIMVPIVAAEQLSQDVLIRLMQANFDTALDARYAISRGVLWGTYIHPLTSLTESDFLSGLIQSITVASNFGTSYSSGAIIFGGGDSRSIQEEELFERLQKLSEEEARKTV